MNGAGHVQFRHLVEEQLLRKKWRDQIEQAASSRTPSGSNMNNDELRRWLKHAADLLETFAKDASSERGFAQLRLGPVGG